MHPELYLVIYRQQERELEQRLALRRTLAERDRHDDRPGAVRPAGWRRALALTARQGRLAPVSRRRAPAPIGRACPAPASCAA